MSVIMYKLHATFTTLVLCVCAVSGLCDATLSNWLNLMQRSHNGTMHCLIILYQDDHMKYKLKTTCTLMRASSLCIPATSTGLLQGLGNTSGGACRTKWMKLVLRVGQSKYFCGAECVNGTQLFDKQC